VSATRMLQHPIERFSSLVFIAHGAPRAAGYRGPMSRTGWRGAAAVRLKLARAGARGQSGPWPTVPQLRPVNRFPVSGVQTNRPTAAGTRLIATAS
jgi:hypothetical protein